MAKQKVRGVVTVGTASGLAIALAALQAELAAVLERQIVLDKRKAAIQAAIFALCGVDDGGWPPDTQNAGALEIRTSAVRTGDDMSGSATRATVAPSLPPLGGNFWKDLVSGQPQSAPEIIKLAIAKLEVPPTERSLVVFKLRGGNALNILAKTNVIRSEGSGRDRRFFCGEKYTRELRGKPPLCTSDEGA